MPHYLPVDMADADVCALAAPLLCAQLCPILLDLINSMSKVQSLPADFGPKVSMRLGEPPAAVQGQWRGPGLC